MSPEPPRALLEDGTSVEPPAPAYAEDGVDLSLIHWMLSLTPTERLRSLERHVHMLHRLRNPKPTESEMDSDSILSVLKAHRVAFILVGEVGAYLHGVWPVTMSFEIVHARTAENITRLVAALRELKALYRDIAGRRIEPTVYGLDSPGHHLFHTDAGPL